MSLVLNTNASGGGWYTLSNESLWMFPDFQNSAQFFIDWIIGTTHWYTTSDWHYVANINWTKINDRCMNIVAPDYYTWVNTNHLWMCWIIMYWQASTIDTYSISRRFAIYDQLNWWEIVWKKIIFPFVVSEYAGSTWNYSKQGKYTYTVQLLHSDWTLTDIATKTHTYGMSNISLWSSWTQRIILDGTRVSQSLSRMSMQNVVWDTLYTWNWVVASAWDYLCLKIDLTEANAWSWDTLYNWINFWFKYTSEDWERYKPVEVSLD